MLKEERHTLSIMRPPTRFRQLHHSQPTLSPPTVSHTYRRTNINRLQPRTQFLLLLMRHRIRDDQLREPTVVQRLDRIPRQDAMRDDRNRLAGAMVHDHIGGFDEGPAGVGHVIYDDGDAVRDVADEDHATDFVGAGALFVD